MKIGVFVLLFLVSSSFLVYAADDTTVSGNLKLDDVNNEFGAIRGNIESSTENVLAREIQFPNWISGFMNHLIGKVTIERLILLAGIAVVLFIMINAAVSMMPFFDEKFIKLGVSGTVTLIVLISGVLQFLVTYYYNLFSVILWLDKLGPFKIFVYAGGLFLIIMVISAIMKKFDRSLLMEKARASGDNINTVSEVGKIMGKNM